MEYVAGKAYVVAICKEHGEFTQLASDHGKGIGCAKCGTKVWDTVSFIAAARKVHGDVYDYSKVAYSKAHGKVTVVCPTHGEFEQGATYHVNNGHGCPKCGQALSSKGQNEIAALLKTYVEVVDNHKLPSGKHIDVFIPSLNIGVEYHGLIWHSEKFQRSHMRDYAKHKEALANGIRLIQVYEDEWNFRKHAVTALLLNAVGVPRERIYARACHVSLVDASAATTFYEENHIQGSVRSPCTHLGLYHQHRLVAVMSFSRVTSVRGSKADASEVELRRFASAAAVIGGGSKLLSHFLASEPQVSTVISYSDNRLFTGALYSALGFTKDSESEPSYCYVNPSVRWREAKHKFKRSVLATRAGFAFDPSKSEKENCEANNWFRVYDCGKTKWVLRR
jgi:hypothetical protein